VGWSQKGEVNIKQSQEKWGKSEKKRRKWLSDQYPQRHAKTAKATKNTTWGKIASCNHGIG